MQAWLASLTSKLVELVLSWFARMVSAFIKNEEMKAKRKKADEEALKTYKESIASDKPHDERVKDAENFLNNHYP